jgi:polar amino acid transport system substrate-binding protein
MNMNMNMKFVSCLALCMCSGVSFSVELADICKLPQYADNNAGNLIAYVAEMPLLAESSERGGFIELIKALDEVYAGGKIEIRIYPFTRAIHGVAHGDADFSLPAAFNPKRIDSDGPVRLSLVSFGKVPMVLYSHKDNVVKVAELGNEALRIIAVPTLWHFPVVRVNSIPQAFELLRKPRVDGILGAQEETDFVLRNAGYKDIHREYYGSFDDVFILPVNERGQLVECVLYRGVETLRRSGKLSAIYSNIHSPYSDWQTY